MFWFIYMLTVRWQAFMFNVDVLAIGVEAFKTITS